LVVLLSEQNRSRGLAGQGTVEGDERQTCFFGKGSQIGIGPCLGRGGIGRCAVAKNGFDAGGLIGEYGVA